MVQVTERREGVAVMDIQLFAGDGSGSDPSGAGGAGDPGGSGGQPGNAGGNPSNGGGQSQRVFSEEYVSALRSESAGYRTQLRGLEAAVRNLVGLKPDEPINENVLGQFGQNQKQAVEKAQEAAKRMLLKAEVRMQSIDLKIVDPDAAIALADLSKVQVAEDGKVTGVKEALEALVKEKPYLVGKGSAGGVGSPGSPGGGSTGLTPEEEGRRLAEERNKADVERNKPKGFDPWARG